MSNHAAVEQLRSRLGGIAFGGDYNPEQWPEEVWAEDMRLMREAAVSLVSVGIFAWARVEPRPGEFDFAWFDRVMDNLAANGVAACLATMTASPPPWLAARHPETLPVREDGVRLWPGARQHFCPSSPIYREYAGRLVERVATRYAEHPALALWHIGNEYGCHVGACYCEVSAADFQCWLRERYGDITSLNEAWSTSFWSQAYGSFDEVLPPRTAPTFPNPAQQIDFARFSSDALLDCFLTEKEIVNRITPHVPVTTNVMSGWKPVDLFRWARHQDVISYDSYPDPHDPRAHVAAGFAYDLMRSLGGGRPWLLMEQAPGAVNWRARNAAKPAGQMRLWSWQAITQGADSALFFQWRASRGGAEKFHSGMVPHAGPNSRVFREIRELGSELTGAAELVGTRVDADVAMLMDWPSWWGLELDARPSGGLRQRDANLAHYAPLFDANVACDVVHPSWDLSAYELVVVPNLYMLDERTAANLEGYVHAGGHLAVSFFSGIVDEHDRVHLGGYPAPLRSMLGLRVEEFRPLPERANVTLDLFGEKATGTLWSEEIIVEGAAAAGTFTTTELAGHPAVTRHPYGSGVAWYLGTRLDPAAMRSLMDRVRADAGVEPVLQGLPDGVQAAVRRGPDASYLLLLNHTTEPQQVTLPGQVTCVLGDRPAASGGLRLAPRGVSLLRR